MPLPPNSRGPVEGTIRREHREALLRQRGLAVWMCGLSGAGKTSLAHEVQRALHAEGKLVAVLDGDALRAGLNSNLGFSEVDRTENIRRVAHTARLLVDTGIIVVVATISPTHALRALARAVLGDADYLEVFVNCPLETCERRDVKGLYRRARAGELRNFTGIDAPFEVPGGADVELRTDMVTLAQGATQLAAAIAVRIAGSAAT
jgi:adenylylsulfate kinase